MPANENVRHYENAVESGPFLLGDLNAIFKHVHQDVLQVRNALFLFLLACDVQSSVGYHLHQGIITLRKM
jgi:hypothetical protein